ncbi:MAG: hypothetical protein K2X87_01035 [Gemmataceae bacterium]|nr:hypothetical protein [Gemmataceae bacterium]
MPAPRKPSTNPARRAPRFRPTFERFESRDLPAGLFLQGQSFTDANGNGLLDPTESYLPGATVELRTADGTALLATAITDALGQYRFTDANVAGGLVPGTYRLVELPPAGYANQDASAARWQLGGAARVDARTLQVTLTDPVTSPLQLEYTSKPLFANLRLTLTDPLPTAVDGITSSGRFIEPTGQFNVTLSGGATTGPTPAITYCVDLTRRLPTGTVLPVRPLTAPLAPTLTVNSGRMGYLHNHYGLDGFASNPPAAALFASAGVPAYTANPLTAEAENAAAFQVALWELSYDATAVAGSLEAGNFFYRAIEGRPDFSTDPVSARIRAKAYAFLQDSVGKDEPLAYLDGPITTNTQLTILGGSLNFANVPAAALGDYVWEDANGNGRQDTGEPGIDGVTVTLTGTTAGGGSVTRITTTAGGGLYLFDGLAPGTYKVTFPALIGYTRTVANAAGDAVDSDADATTGMTGSYTLAAGQTDRTVDAGYYRPVSVGDFVWEDRNANGQQDAGEPGIDGVRVTLTGADGAGNSITRTTATAGGGGYLFDGLSPGTYTVAVDTTSPALAGYVPTVTGQGGPATDSNPNPTAPVTLPSGGSDRTLDFGFYRPAQLGDFVWEDVNGNGIQDSGQAGINGVALTLTGTDGAGNAVTRSATTAGGGLYLFDGLVPGTYAVAVDAANFAAGGPLAGYSASPTLQGADRGADSNPSPTGTTPAALPGGASDRTLDFGYYPAVRRLDVEKTTAGSPNGNTTAPDYDNEDTPTGAGVPVFAPGTAITWTYQVTNTGNVPFAAADIRLTDDNGTPANPADDLSVAAGTITPVPGQAAAADGVLSPGEVWLYRAAGTALDLSATATGVYANAATVTAPNTPADSDLSHYRNPPPPTGSLSGRKFLDVSGNGLNTTAGPNSPADTPLAGVTVYLDLDNDGVKDDGEPWRVTNGNGEYTFTGLSAGTYRVREVVPAGYVRTAPTLTNGYVVALAAGQGVGGLDFANAEKCDPYTVTDLSFRIAHADGTTATVADLRGNTREGDVITATFKVNVPAGQTHAVTFVSYTAPEPYFNANTAGQQVIYDLATGEFGPGTGTLTVRLPNSYYQVDLVCGPAIDKLGPAGSNIFYTPQGRLESADNGGTTPVRADAGTVAGVKFSDRDADGVREAGEPGLGGWTIYADLNGNSARDAAEPATVTAADGSYRLSNVPAGTVVLREVQRAGWEASRTPGAFALAAGGAATGKDFGNFQPAAVSGYKFNDRNADGVWDRNGLDNGSGTADDEVGLSGWTIFVDYDADGVLDAGEPSAVTGSDGSYAIAGVRPGSYPVREVARAGWAQTTATPTVNLLSGDRAANVNFGNVYGAVLARGDTATIGFWQNKNGQDLLKSLNGGPTAKALGNWLATNFPKLFGSSAGAGNNLANKTNAQVAAYFVTLFDRAGPKVEAQVLATAFAVYVTDRELAGKDGGGRDYAAQYGFTVTAAGIADKLVNVGGNGAAFGVADGTALTVRQLLDRANDRASGGLVWRGNGTKRGQVCDVFGGLNEAGDIG